MCLLQEKYYTDFQSSDPIHFPSTTELSEQNLKRNSPVWGFNRAIYSPRFWKKKMRIKLSLGTKYVFTTTGRWDFFVWIRCILQMLITVCLQQIALRVQHVRNGNSSDFRAFTCEIPRACILLVPVSFLLNKSTTQSLRRWKSGEKWWLGDIFCDVV